MKPRFLLLAALLCTTLSALPLTRAQGTQPTAPLTDEATPAENTRRAWNLLTTTVKDTKHVDAAIQALAALGTMGSNGRAADLINEALKNSERDIRTAAVLAFLTSCRNKLC